jgi:23S rRNA (cytosine1962-C5)-methyltransferase
MNELPEIILKPGREKSLLRRHPWIFSGAINTIHGSPKLGETVAIVSSKGEFLAKAAFNPNSNISGRVWTWNQSEIVDENFLARRILHATEIRREQKDLIHSNAMRLVHAESDGLPGLVLDQYGEVCVVQFLTAGAEYWKEPIVDGIRTATQAKTIYERSNVDVRQLEGLSLSSGLLFGDAIGGQVEIVENDLKFLVDVVDGHKTGFYLDQRDNRYTARQISEGRKVLDCFAYTGGFSLNCALGGAKDIFVVDASATALEIARSNVQNNNLKNCNINYIEYDVFKYLRILRDQAESFDLIILDPPKFAPTAAQAERAARGYKDINLLALKLLNPQGYLLTFSCSGGISEELFQKIVAGAALDAGVEAVIVKRLFQAIDHPVALNFPEGAYLKGFLIKKLN